MNALLLLTAAAATGLAALVLLEERSRARPGRRVEDYVGALRAEAPLRGGRLATTLASRFSVGGVRAAELAGAGSLGMLGLALGAARGAAAAVVLALWLGAVGFFAPRFVLVLRARRRAERIRADLPDALDLLAVTVRAGLGLDAAMARIAAATTGPLAEELALVLTETRIGEGRRRALERMAARVNAREVTSFVRAVVQGEQLGTSLAETLRSQALEARNRRQAAAEERASKASVKMVFPTALLIFPALFVVILAPTILSIATEL